MHARTASVRSAPLPGRPLGPYPQPPPHPPTHAQQAKPASCWLQGCCQEVARAADRGCSITALQTPMAACGRHGALLRLQACTATLHGCTAPPTGHSTTPLALQMAKWPIAAKCISSQCHHTQQEGRGQQQRKGTKGKTHRVCVRNQRGFRRWRQPLLRHTQPPFCCCAQLQPAIIDRCSDPAIALAHRHPLPKPTWVGMKWVQVLSGQVSLPGKPLLCIKLQSTGRHHHCVPYMQAAALQAATAQLRQRAANTQSTATWPAVPTCCSCARRAPYPHKAQAEGSSRLQAGQACVSGRPGRAYPSPTKPQPRTSACPQFWATPTAPQPAPALPQQLCCCAAAGAAQSMPPARSCSSPSRLSTSSTWSARPRIRSTEAAGPSPARQEASV